MRSTLLVGTTLILLGLAGSAFGIDPPNRFTDRHGINPTWHGSYYDPGWGAPVAVVVPPTAKRQFHYSWGVGSARVTRTWPHFELGYQGPSVVGPGTFLPPPAWPSDTDQLGNYYVRGPW